MNPTRSQIETRADILSKTGWKLALWDTPNGWRWDWQLQGVYVTSGHTDVAVKPVAFVFALMSCPI